MISTRFFECDGPIPFAHRGGAAHGAENTMAAFESAIRLGFRYLETDVHATSDGVVVAFHDSRLDRLTDRSGRIRELPWSSVSRARISGMHPIPRLEEVLSAWPEARLNIDAKDNRVVTPLLEVIRRTGSEARVCLASFSDRRVARMRRAIPGSATSFGAAAVSALRIWGRLPSRADWRTCVQVPPRAYGVEVVNERLIEIAHSRGLQVHVWTVDDAAEMNRLLDLGVDGIMTDEPGVLRSVLIERGSWPH